MLCPICHDYHNNCTYIGIQQYSITTENKYFMQEKQVMFTSLIGSNEKRTIIQKKSFRDGADYRDKSVI